MTRLVIATLLALSAVVLWRCGGKGSATPTSPTTPTSADACARLSGPESMPFFVYVNGGDRRNHFIASGYFGDSSDLTLDDADTSGPHSGPTSIRIQYRPQGPQGFAGIFWQCPANNWGTVANAGFDLTRARRVRFFARASRAGVRVEFKVGGLGWTVPREPFPDSLPSTATSPVIVDLDTEWREFTIDVSGQDLGHVIGGFMFVTSIVQNATGAIVFLDDIVWE